MIKMDERIWLATPDGIHNTYGIEIVTDDSNKLIQFKELVWESPMFKKYNGFWQGSDSNWLYLEFLYMPNDQIKSEAIDLLNHISKELGVAIVDNVDFNSFVKVSSSSNLYRFDGKYFRLWATGSTDCWLINPKMVEVKEIDADAGRNIWGSVVYEFCAWGTVPSSYQYIRYEAGE